MVYVGELFLSVLCVFATRVVQTMVKDKNSRQSLGARTPIVPIGKDI